MSVRGVNKVSIIGAGAVGSSLAYASLIRGVARHVVLHDINAAKVRAEALDLAHGSQFMPQAKIEGSEDPEVTRGSDVVVITAGAKQRGNPNGSGSLHREPDEEGNPAAGGAFARGDFPHGD